MALLAAGCEWTEQGTTDDLAAVAVDLAALDLARPPDLTRVSHGTEATGRPCRASVECLPSTSGTKSGVCTKTSQIALNVVTWPGGYCQSPCLAKNVDPKSGLSWDCSGDITTCMLTSQTSGLCVEGCVRAFDCRQEYTCASITGTRLAACVPLASSACDPADDPLPQGKSCADGQRCLPFSPDNSWGQCATVCDPLLQDCPFDEDFCVVERGDPRGLGTCIGTIGQDFGGEGQLCPVGGMCARGLVCEQGHCRRYCRLGDAPCPPDAPLCADLTGADFDASVLGVCVP